MTPEQVAAERERFEDVAPRFGIRCPRPVDGVAYTFRPVPFANAAANDAWDLWLRRAEIAHAREKDLQDKIAKLRERVRVHAKEKLKEWRDNESEYSSEWLWEWATEDEPSIIELAEEAGCWLDNNNNEVPLAEWRARQGGVG